MVTRESDFDDYARSEIFALMIVKARQCPRCQNFDTLVPLTDEVNDKHTTAHNGVTFGVRQLRCVACGLSDLVERDAARATRAQPEPSPGKPAPGDGRMFIVQPIDPDEPDESEVT